MGEPPHNATTTSIAPEDDLTELVGWIGREIDGRYRITEIIGEGGMGAVFAAMHLGLHKEVALKVVRPQHAGNAAQAARFTREAMVTSRIDHRRRSARVKAPCPGRASPSSARRSPTRCSPRAATASFTGT
jgi:hypothetical protein